MSEDDRVVDRTMPAGKWTFDGDVAAAFDDMLARSIPQYDVMRDAVFSIGQHFVKHGTNVVDLGCSRGESLASFVDKFGAHNRFVGVEVSEPMLVAARARFDGYIKTGVVDVKNLDLRRCYPPVSASLTMAVLTLQFVPIEHRQRVVQDVFDHTISGGAFVLVEKVLGATARIDRLLVDRYYKMKADHGYSQDSIERKRLALEGVLVPVTAAWNEELLRQAGFTEIDCFWRWANFAGWIAIKR
jgi:tRNA (cmo5U34)-methyltransferase